MFLANDSLFEGAAECLAKHQHAEQMSNGIKHVIIRLFKEQVHLMTS